MPSDKPARRLEDIVENAQAIQRYVAGMDVTAFAKDQKTYDAVERCLERISEAAAKLGDMALSLEVRVEIVVQRYTHHLAGHPGWEFRGLRITGLRTESDSQVLEQRARGL